MGEENNIVTTTPIINPRDQRTSYPYMPTTSNVAARGGIVGMIRRWFAPQESHSLIAEAPINNAPTHEAALEETGPDIKEIFRGALNRVLEWYDNDDSIIRRDKFDTYASMMTDAAVYNAVNSKRFAVCSASWRIKPASNSRIDREIAEFCEWNFHRCRGTVAGMTFQMLSSLYNGYSVNEMCFAPIASGKWQGKVRLAALRNKDPQDFGFKLDFAGNVCEIWLGYRSPIRVPLPIWKFVVHVHCPEYDRPWGHSDLRAAWKYWWIKEKVLKYWGMYVQNYAAPLKHGKVPPGSKIMTPEFLTHLTNFGGEYNTLIMPSDFDLSILQPGASDNQNFNSLISYCDAQIDKAIKGQTLTSSEGSGTGSYALGKVHENTFEDWVEFTRLEIAELYKECVIKTEVDLNYSDVDEYPSFVYNPHRDRIMIQNMADLKALFETPMLIESDINNFRDRIDLPPNEKYIDNDKPVQLVAPGAAVSIGNEPENDSGEDAETLDDSELKAAYESAYDMSEFSAEYKEAFKNNFSDLNIVDDGAGKPWIHIRETSGMLRARIKEPSDFQPGTFRNVVFTKDPNEKKQVKAIIGKLKNSSDDRMTTQAYLFPKDSWTLSSVRSWLNNHLGKSKNSKYAKKQKRRINDADMFECELRLGGADYYKREVDKRDKYDAELVAAVMPIMAECKLAVQDIVEKKVLYIDKNGNTAANIDELYNLRIPKNIISKINNAIVPWSKKLTINEYIDALKEVNQNKKSIPKFDKSEYAVTDITLEVGTSAADKKKLSKLQAAEDYEAIALWRKKKIQSLVGTQESSMKLMFTGEVESETIATVKDAVQFGIKNGQSAKTISKTIGDVFNKYGADKNVPADKLLLIARTETTREIAESRLAAFTDPLSSDEFPAQMISEVMDDATCDECIERDGMMFENDDPELSTIEMPLHPNCRGTWVPVPAAEWEKHGGK
jgi:SPP1 gp7 family putative phage head morphogenesis protein